MIFEIFSTLEPGVFYSKNLNGRSGYYFLPIRMLTPCDNLYCKTYELPSHLSTNFVVGIVGQGGYVADLQNAVGFMFYSKLPVNNYCTAIMSFSRAWQRTIGTSDDVSLEASLVLKTTEFYMYDVPGIATLVTCPELSDRLSEFLTMI